MLKLSVPRRGGGMVYAVVSKTTSRKAVRVRLPLSAQMNFKKIHHIAIICSDYQKSKEFYTQILGFEIIKETFRKERDSYKLDLQFGDTQIELFSFPNTPKRTTNPEATGLRHLAFEVENLEETINELRRKNIICEQARIDPITNKKFTFFFDPDRLPLELYEK